MRAHKEIADPEYYVRTRSSESREETPEKIPFQYHYRRENGTDYKRRFQPIHGFIL